MWEIPKIGKFSVHSKCQRATNMKRYSGYKIRILQQIATNREANIRGERAVFDNISYSSQETGIAFG